MAFILGADLGSRLCGWCAGDGAGVPQVGSWVMPVIGNSTEGWDYGMLLAALEEAFLGLVTRLPPLDGVVFEAPIHIPKGPSRPYGDTLHKMRLLYPMGAFLEYLCGPTRCDIPCHEVMVAEIKSEVTGNPYAEKDDLVGVAEACGLNLPSGEARKDAADAWGAWLLGLRHYDPMRSAEWDSRIRAPRGGLL